MTAYFPIGGQGSLHRTTSFKPKTNASSTWVAVKGRPSLLDDSTVKELAVKYNATAAQVLLAWGLSRGYSVIPKSVTPGTYNLLAYAVYCIFHPDMLAARIKSNLVKVTLSAEDLQRVGDIGKGKQLRSVVFFLFNLAQFVKVARLHLVL